MLLCLIEPPFLMENFPQPYSEIRNSLFQGTLSCVDLVRQYLSRIDALNKQLNVFLEVYSEEALASARLIDQKIKDGKAGKLAGMVVGINFMLYYIVKYKFGWLDETLPDQSEWWFGISPEGFGAVAMLINFVVSITVMQFTKAPPEDVQEIVENIRIN